MSRHAMRERMERHHRHHRECRDHRHGPRHFRGGRHLHRRIILRSGLSILVVVLAVSAFVRNDGSARPIASLEHLAAAQLAEVWHDPALRQASAQRLGEQMQARITLRDTGGEVLTEIGKRCPQQGAPTLVVAGGVPVGAISVCGLASSHRKRLFLGIGFAALALWLSVAFIARRLLAPLREVAAVARRIEAGDLSSRVQYRHRADEVGQLGEAINDMAERIEKQLSDQKQLLAAVSHEIRTPLGHMRVMTELAREGDASKLDELDQEIAAVDTLVGQLLANSRLEFEVIDFRSVDVADLCATLLERAGLDASLLQVDDGGSTVLGDPMLLTRAIANLVENAQVHAGGVASVRLATEGDELVIQVADLGKGFLDAELSQVFTPFFRGQRKVGASEGNLGLGLTLVDKIALAHRGQAFASNSESGAIVGFRVPLADS